MFSIHTKVPILSPSHKKNLPHTARDVGVPKIIVVNNVNLPVLIFMTTNNALVTLIIIKKDKYGEYI